MLEKVRQYKEFVFIFLFIFILNSLINFSPGDDEYFKNISKTMSLYDFIYMRYTIWSGRVFADSILYLIMDENIWIWRILNSIIIFMLPIAIVRIFSMKISFKYFLIAFCSICCISFNVISSGFLWVTGSINYSWPILLGILSSIIYTDILFNKTHKLKRKY
ncbi:hypothetical protein PaeCFBP13512_19365, partial [Paenibacillus sp. CFBP13512]|uniref:DUF6056 family protein n=1 Tax=Paenibacillus sp. CFBP13512 TaxID=2184007 RepID=UPI0010C1006E